MTHPISMELRCRNAPDVNTTWLFTSCYKAPGRAHAPVWHIPPNPCQLPLQVDTLFSAKLKLFAGQKLGGPCLQSWGTWPL